MTQAGTKTECIGGLTRVRPPTLAGRNGRALCALMDARFCARDVGPRIWVATKNPHPVRGEGCSGLVGKPLGLVVPIERLDSSLGLFIEINFDVGHSVAMDWLEVPNPYGVYHSILG